MSAALASLTSQYSDSENEGEEHKNEPKLQSEEEAVDEADFGLPKQKSLLSVIDTKVISASNSPASVLGTNTIESLNKPRQAEFDEKLEHRLDSIDDQICDDDYEERFSSPIEFHRSLLGVSRSQIKIPSDPPGRCSNTLIEKVTGLYNKMKEGRDMNAIIQKRKDFRNPSIYEKLIAYCGIDELGTNYPPEINDPHRWAPESYYEELAKKQKEEMDKREKEKRERTKVEFVTGTVRKSATDGEGSKKRSKWDVAGSNSNVGSLISNVRSSNSSSSVNLHSGTKATVISAFGSINKRR